MKPTSDLALKTLIGRIVLVALAVCGAGLLLTFEFPPISTVQGGFRGVGMVQNFNPRIIEARLDANQVPAPLDPAEPGSGRAGDAYQNLQVLGDLTENEMLRIMQAVTEWVSPEQGCAYCHAEGEDFSSDSLYSKVVSRRMFQMTRDINIDWTSHVAQTGVTCYTCHRGQPVPANVWFNDPGRVAAPGLLGNPAGQNGPAPTAGLSSLPADPFTPYLTGGGKDHLIRIASGTVLPEGNRRSIKETEWTYSLMIHMAESLGVNCTYCHNSRNFRDWSESTPARGSAWHGIQMVRGLNAEYLEPLQSVFPSHRLGALGDSPKVNCATCHAGVYKPLFGVSMLKDYPELVRAAAGAAPAPAQ